MRENDNLKYAGDLVDEVKEGVKTCCFDSEMERGRTTTSDCSGFLTIFCC